MRMLRSSSLAACVSLRVLLTGRTAAVAASPLSSSSSSFLFHHHKPIRHAGRCVTTTRRTVVTTMRGGGGGGGDDKDETTKHADAATTAATTTATTLPIPPLRYLGDERLMQRQSPVTSHDIQHQDFAGQLEMLRRAMQHYGGIGIAAPQVGWWTRVFVFGIPKGGSNPRYPTGAEIPLQYWINPEITWSSDETNWMWEGCLSVPGMRGWVQRPAAVVLRGWDETGQVCEKRLEGLAARVAQHELDHLDGILFPLRVPGPPFLVPQASMDARDGRGANWPSPGSHKTRLGELCDEK